MIDGPVSGRWAAVEARAFLSELSPEGAEVESYLLSLAEPLEAMARKLEPVGLAPGPLKSLADRIARAREACPTLGDLPPLRRAEMALRRRAALLHAYGGAVRPAIGQLIGPQDTPDVHPEQTVPEQAVPGQALPEQAVPDRAGQDRSRPDISPRKRLEEALRAAQDEGLRRELQWLADHWTLPVPSSEKGRGTWVPALERLPSWASGPRRAEGASRPQVGALRRVALSLRGPAGEAAETAGEAKDQLWTGTSPEKDLGPVATGPVATARALLERERPALRGQPLEGHLSFDWSHLRREGRSAGLAVASLFYAEALETAGRRRRLALRPEAAFTGAISAGPRAGNAEQSPSRDGKTVTQEDASQERLPQQRAVQPVSDQGLPVKVQAAFFSPQDTLAVPKAQETRARRVRDRLLEGHPGGQLNIVGIFRLCDVMDHRRLTRRIETSWPRHAARRLWAWRGQVAAGTVIVALLLALGRLLYGPLDKTPATADFEGEQMIVKNASGAVIEKITVGAKVVRRVHDPRKQYRAYAFHDVTGDGQKEICWGQNTPQSDEKDFLACKEVGASEPLWRFPLDSLAAPFPNKPAVQAGKYMATGMVVGDFTGGGRPDLYVTTAHQPYFPSLFLQLDARTGEEMGRYLHAGHFKAGPVPVDLEGDGTEELLIGGHTNAYNQAAFAVLDPRRIEGHGPVTPEYAAAGHDPAAERAYVRVPRTKVGAAQGEGLSLVREIEAREDGRIEVQVREGRVGGEGQANEAYVFVYFDRSLRPQAVGTSSHYDRLADTLAQRGEIGAVPGPGYFERYRGRLRYWTGEGWQTEPTMSMRWRQEERVSSDGQE